MKNESKYNRFALVNEMMETPQIVRSYSLPEIGKVAEVIKKMGKLFLTGEGSSRIFPAKNAIYSSMRGGYSLNLMTEGSRQATEYDLREYAVFGASNSGSTKELITLYDRLKKIGHENRFGLTARENTKLAEVADECFVLSCGWENAVAATKSVVEQALFYQMLLAEVEGRNLEGKLAELGDAIEDALIVEIDGGIVEKIANAGTIYFAGRNDGVAEELTLKTNEIVRKKSDYLEGTYAVHGIEEIMEAGDVVIVINPFGSEQEKFKEVLVDGVGLNVVAVSDEETIFPTIKVKDIGEMQNYVYLAAGWNILVEAGVKLGIDLDKAQRARKVGNEFK